MTNEEIVELGAQLRPLVDPELIRIASVDGQPVGVGLMLPNYNEPIKHLNGRLWPFGAPYILASRYLRRIRGTRLLMLGVVPEYQRRGLDALLLHELYGAALRQGYDWCEVGWVLEKNHVMNNAIQSWGLDLSARYRVYERAFATGRALATGSPKPSGPD
jgi:GNAT superfamily N-acetyltransferase